MLHRLIEELSLNAWPSLQTVCNDGWILRFADGYTRRANSVNPLYPSSGSVDTGDRIAHCEALYTSRGQDTMFKLTAASEPPDLDAILAARGYRQEAVTSVQVRDLESDDVSPVGSVAIGDRLTDDWLAGFCRLSGVAGRHVPTMARLLGLIVPPRCFILLHHEGETVAAGLAVAERGHVGLFDGVTAPRARRQGFGTQLVLQMLGWGKASGAGRAYLQVMLDNTPARHLYDRLGFREAYRYWYRVRTMGS